MILVMWLCLIAQQGVGSTSPGTAEIRGRVTDAESGAPLTGIAIRIMRQGDPSPFSTRTDSTGAYRFTNLPAGRYQGSVVHDRHQGKYEIFQPLSTVLKDGEVRDLNIALRRTRAILVRAQDEWGDPLSGLTVSVRDATTGRTVGDFFMQRTDDLGRVRLFGLRPGRYTICTDPSESGLPPGDNHGGVGLLSTCYPSATDPQLAEVVAVDRTDVGELEIRVRTGATFTITGTVLDASGKAAVNAMLSLSIFQRNGSASRGVAVDDQGGFTIPGIQPGEYAIQASLGGPDRPEQRRPFEGAFLPLDVQTDLDLVVRMERGVDVNGRVTLEDPTVPLPPPPGSGLMIGTRLAEDRLQGHGSAQTAIMQRDRTFTLTNVFGTRRLHVHNVPSGWYLKSVLYQGKDIIDRPVGFEKARDPAIEVVLSNRGASVSGQVLDSAGRPVGRAHVLAVRADDPRPDVHFRTRAARDGGYRLGPLREGEYFVLAAQADDEPLQDGDWQRLARLLSSAVRVTLGLNGERTVDLRVSEER